jgi:uncharacterized protein YigE (DUF2233 family)
MMRLAQQPFSGNTPASPPPDTHKGYPYISTRPHPPRATGLGKRGRAYTYVGMPLVGIRGWGGWGGNIRRAYQFLVVCLLLLSLAACDGPTITIGGSASPTPNDIPASVQLNTWYTVAKGAQVRYEDWKTSDGTDDTVTIARFDPNSVTLSVGYNPQSPRFASQWMQQTQALAVINGGYFDANDNATALVISNGQATGSSYSGFGGMLSVDAQGHISLRSLREQPYNSGEALTQATQSSPMLALNGKRTQFTADASTSRRSVVAIDKQGRLLFIASPGETFSLDQLATLLVSSDLDIDTALNLDGGGSTGLYINGSGSGSGSQHVAIDSLVALPLVVIVKEK